MKTFRITIHCHNAEGLREALQDLAEEVSLGRDNIDATTSPGDELLIDNLPLWSVELV